MIWLHWDFCIGRELMLGVFLTTTITGQMHTTVHSLHTFYFLRNSFLFCLLFYWYLLSSTFLSKKFLQMGQDAGQRLLIFKTSSRTFTHVTSSRVGNRTILTPQSSTSVSAILLAHLPACTSLSKPAGALFCHSLNTLHPVSVSFSFKDYHRN